MCTQLMCLYRTATNMTKKTSTDTAANGNNKENQLGTSGDGTGGGGYGEEQNPSEAKEGHNVENYDARQARKCTKKKEQVDSFQEWPVKAIEVPQVQVESSVPTPTPKHEYLDIAFEAMAFNMRDVLSKEEIIDLVEDLENLVSKACREKRWMEMVKNLTVPPQHPLQDKMYGSTRTHGCSSTVQ